MSAAPRVIWRVVASITGQVRYEEGEEVELKSERAVRYLHESELAKGCRVSIPTATMEQEFATHERRGYAKAESELAALRAERDEWKEAYENQRQIIEGEMRPRVNALRAESKTWENEAERHSRRYEQYVVEAEAREATLQAKVEALRSALRQHAVTRGKDGARCYRCWGGKEGYGEWRSGQPERHAPGCLAAKEEG